ncbi:putative endonuclease [Ruminococcaceae bacterium YAD3003]|nr:putative endonuclease [Ruminococcaceae bacterium YAD3003]
MTNRKTLKQFIGDSGEEASVKMLESEGYKILRRNYAIHNVGEIDIIAEKDGEIHICEVRTRLNIGPYPDSTESVTRSKRNKVVRTAEFFVAENNLYDKNLVFEVVRVTHDKQGNIRRIDCVPF